MKLSIIIPVYNLEHLISRCLDSIISQPFDDYEIILIDDGSTDGSVSICESYSLIDKRIKIILQENSGVSIARNKGIKEAVGTWLCFVDGDDFLEHNSLSVLNEYNDIDEVDCIILRSFSNNGEGSSLEKYSFPKKYVDKKFKGIDLALKENYFRGSIWGVFYRRETILNNHILFPTNIRNGEDTIFFSLVLINFKAITFNNSILYYVFERDGSATRSWSLERIIGMIDNLTYINLFIHNSPKLPIEGKYILNYNIYRVISAIYNAFSNCFSIKGFNKLNTLIKKELPYKLEIGPIRLSNSKIKLLNKSLFLFASSILIKNRFKK